MGELSILGRIRAIFDMGDAILYLPVAYCNRQL